MEFIKCVIFKCYSSEKLITLNTLHKAVPPGTHFTAESTEAMRIKCLAQGYNVLLPGFKTSNSVSRNKHPEHMTSMPLVLEDVTDIQSMSFPSGSGEVSLKR